MKTYLNAEELLLIQTFSHESKNAFVNDLSSSIPHIQDEELSAICKKLLLKVRNMTEEEFFFNNIAESEVES